MMVLGAFLTGCLILLASLPLVSGQCSTCLEEKCHDNGECIIGCIPGYVGKYCNKACPSRCLNKACHIHIVSGAITCTYGCEPGYCDIKCEVKCPGDCVTCDRKCSSCNVTLCPERRYGPDCSRVCNERYGTCDRETGQCVRCRRGYYGDECKQECCLIFVICHSLVSGLCSTCLEEQCHDNGECIIGCVPGYVGEYCDEDCPPRCLNKACHVHISSSVVTCTDGCEPGYCDIKCEVECPGDCVTCDRQCGNCNVTLCTERHYGTECSETCSPRYEKCDRETGQCIRCRRGFFGDKCKQECTVCFTTEDNIRDTCLSGCEICQTEETCPVWFYGDSCKVRCSTGCGNPGGCNRATGECSTGCVSGYHGLTCNYTCNSFCEGWTCNQQNGVCTSRCISGYKSKFDMCEKYDNEGNYA